MWCFFTANIKWFKTEWNKRIITKFQWKETKFRPILCLNKPTQSFMKRRQYDSVILVWTLFIIRLLGPVRTRTEEFGNEGFTLKTHQMIFFARDAGGSKIKHINQRSFWICVWRKLGQGNHMIIVKSSFSKSYVSKMFPVRTKTKTRRFQIPPDWTAFSKS